MLFLLSYHFLDLRFLITRPVGEDPRHYWLRPQWLWKNLERHQVGKLGESRPIPGRDRLLPDYNRHATVDAGLLLQTAREYDRKRLIRDPEQGGYFIRDRELVADEWGQVRLDLLVEPCDADDAPVGRVLQRLLATPFVAPLRNGQEVPLGEAADVIAGVYEAESLKTCTAFQNPALRELGVQATAGTVVVAADAPQIIVLDLDGRLTDGSRAITECEAPCRGALSAITFTGSAPEATCWHFAAAPQEVAPEQLRYAAWSAAFGLSWLVGHLHELAVLPKRAAEYERSGHRILPETLRQSIKVRNRRFALERFGGWKPEDVLACVARIVWHDGNNAERQLARIRGLVDNPRDAAGVTNRLSPIIQLGGTIDMSERTYTFSGSFVGSNVNVSSVLTDVSQSVGQLAAADADTRERLLKLVEQLHSELDRVAGEQPKRAEEIDAVAVTTKGVVERAQEEQPNRTLLSASINTAKDIARALADVAPAVLTTVSAITDIIAKLYEL